MGLKHVFGISTCSGPMWKKEDFFPQEDFYAELKQVKMPVEDDGKGNDLLHVFLSKTVWWGWVPTRSKAGLLAVPREREK